MKPFDQDADGHRAVIAKEGKIGGLFGDGRVDRSEGDLRPFLSVKARQL